ncbi:MAG: PilZ domain-containing protein [Minwuia sp.]|nr:PilZ domain-containing protein [Minwuia sp.]
MARFNSKWWRGGDRSAGAGERRRSARYPVRLPVTISRFRNDPEGPSLAIDVSDSGMLVKPNLYGSVSEHVFLTTDQFLGQVPAVIAGQRPEGTAVAFADAEMGRRFAALLCARAEGRSGVGPTS